MASKKKTKLMSVKSWAAPVLALFGIATESLIGKTGPPRKPRVKKTAQPPTGAA